MNESVDAKTAVPEMMEAAGINRVICVDDAFAVDVTNFVATLAALDASQRAAVLGLPEAQMAEEDLWQDLARKAWDERDAAGQAALADNAFAYELDLTPIPEGSMRVFGELIPGVDSEMLSLAQWRERQDTIVGELSEKPSLILFDQDFSHEASGTSTSGQKLIAELEAQLQQQGSDVPDAYYGLLTNTATIAEEQTRRQEIVASGDVSASRFVLMAKENLQADELNRFTSRLRTTLLAPIFAQLMDLVLMSASAARDDAESRASSIAPEAMEDMVVRASGYEGVWPPDTLLRILEVMQRKVVRAALRSEDKVVRLTERLRKLADIEPAPTGGAGGGSETQAPPEETGSGAAWFPESVSLAHEEIYETAEHVNRLHLPVELGDFFVRDDGKRFVVIAQPCDLMVRAKGLRAPELTHCLLAEVTPGEAEDSDLFQAFELPYFYEESGASAFVRLGRPAVARSLILDACVVNSDGNAILDQNSSPPAGLLPPWLERRAVLLKAAKATLDRINKVQGDLADETRMAMSGHLKRDPFRVKRADTDAGVLAWDCRRDGRVCDPYARALLSRFSQYFARDAYLFDFARRNAVLG